MRQDSVTFFKMNYNLNLSDFLNLSASQSLKYAKSS